VNAFTLFSKAAGQDNEEEGQCCIMGKRCTCWAWVVWGQRAHQTSSLVYPLSRTAEWAAHL